MFLFLSFLAAMISLYYLGVMVDTYNADTTYLTPLVVLLIYSVISIIRELKRFNFLSLDDEYDNYGGYNYNNNNYYGYRNNNFSDENKWFESYGKSYNKSTDDVEYFTPTVKNKKNDENVLVHYPSNQEVREKMKELEKSKFFRFKKIFANIIGIDITSKYYDEFKKPYNVNRKGKVVSATKPAKKEDYSRYQPRNIWFNEREEKEYNEVGKFISRSCEIAFNDAEASVIFDKETNKIDDNENNK